MNMFKRLVLTFLTVLALAHPSWAVSTVSGAISLPNTAIKLQNGTLTFTLNQSAIVAGSFAVAPVTVNCYTSTNGAIVGLPNPLVAVTATAQAAAGSLSGTYSVKITYYGSGIETLSSVTRSVLVTGPNNSILVTAPTVHPTGATGYKVYASLTAGSELLQATTSGWGTTTINTLASGAALPSSNTSICSLVFNDAFIPFGTKYRVNLVSATGSQIAGFPQDWYLAGSSWDVTNGYPIAPSNIQTRFPTPILQNPSSNALQSVASPVTLNGYSLTAGALVLGNNSSPPSPSPAPGTGSSVIYTDSSNVLNLCSGTGDCWQIAPTSTFNVTALNNIRFCDQFSGANAGAKIINAIAALPSTGGLVYCMVEGAQTISSDIFAGTSGKPFTIVLGNGATWTLTVPLKPFNGQTLEGVGGNNRWRSATSATKLNYTGVTAAIQIAPSAGNGADSVLVRDIQLDGTGATGSVDGILLDGSAAAAYIEGITFDNVTVTNFPRYQVYGKGTVFDIYFDHFTAHNAARAANNLIHYEGSNASTWEFNNPWLVPYTTGKWAFFAGKTGALPTNGISNVIFRGGTVAGGEGTASVSEGANGVWVNGGLSIYGTSFNGSEVDQARTIGIRYTATNGAVISPSQLGFWGTGIELGNSGAEVGGTARTGDDSIGANISGIAGFNNNCVAPITCSDVHVVGGAGSRKGTIIALGGDYTAAGAFGQASGLPYVLNEATLKDDVLITEWTASTGGYPKFGPLHLDIANGRLGLGVDPVLAFQIRAGVSNGIRIENTHNNNNISAQLITSAADKGQLVLYNDANPSVLKVDLLGDGTGTFAGQLSAAGYSTATNCADSAGAAACGSASAGHFVIDAAGTSTVVSTTAVTANSEVIVTRDDGLGTLLSVTCNTQSSLTLGAPRVTARTATTSFTVTIEVGPTTNPMCLGYKIVN